MKVAVVGAGIGGLAAACGLQRLGADVSVLERAVAPPASGSGLSVFGNGWAALDAVGVGDAARAVAGGQVRDLRAGQRRPDGSWLTTTPPGALRDLRILHRADLQQVLLDALAPGTARFGADVTEALPSGEVTTAAGASSERFDLVVAADGIRSRIRASWGRDPGTRYSGYSAWRGITREPVDLLGAAGETWGAGRRFGCAPLRDGRVYWFAVATMPATAVVQDEHAAVVDLVGDWHEPIGSLLACTDPAAVVRHPVSDLARPLPSFRRGRTVLLGDAAHAMTPDLGQGGNQAMEDAATLAALLGGLRGDLHGYAQPDPDRVDRALADYDRLRRRRTQPIARRARTVGRVAQARGRVTVPLRDAALRATPPSALDRAARVVQDWRPPAPGDPRVP
ncbi:2-polyprenyl-6-methoxyphenol hydroxylase-like FAD-dependent oxidoreductase [Nocardioides cavernae]|uniref:2-polyprenyl-6-methoxyphenol hydroxylase-like FAD-dependent oxidoreductase n=1 Tax=Nocardioides cavernae TaxID=1921566 RepID=A0A7Y9H562_9ACTN|nr:FAD-dependent monooxygenase [Nocardioides cavernae]NYE38119.1 2-polyprenyl-6-methoxyphenol hydroxylase-like FAD-dependent oxidoreductase [Nocardioides cavernae]